MFRRIPARELALENLHSLVSFKIVLKKHLDLSEHGHKGNVEEDADGGGEQPGGEVALRAQHQAHHLGGIILKVGSASCDPT